MARASTAPPRSRSPATRCRSSSSAPGVVPAGVRDDSLVSSLDVPPTVLGALGLDYDSRFFGRDLFHSDPAAGRAFLTHNRSIALLQGDRLAVLGLRGSERLFRYRRGHDELEQIAVESDRRPRAARRRGRLLPDRRRAVPQRSLPADDAARRALSGPRSAGPERPGAAIAGDRARARANLPGRDSGGREPRLPRLWRHRLDPGRRRRRRLGPALPLRPRPARPPPARRGRHPAQVRGLHVRELRDRRLG